MALFRKRVSRKIIGRYKAPPEAPDPPLEHLVEESRLVAHSATRMAVKNRLIVAAAGRRVDFDLSALRAAARETLEQLAQQQRAAMDYERYSSMGRRRAPVLEGLAEALEADARDPELLTAIVEGARDAAWAELSSSLAARVRESVDGRDRDPDYLAERPDRLAAFLALDLADLAYDRGVPLD